MIHKLYLCKIATWSILAFSASGIIAYAWTNEIITSGGIAITEFCTKLSMFAMFEYTWNKHCNNNLNTSSNTPVSSASSTSLDI